MRRLSIALGALLAVALVAVLIAVSPSEPAGAVANPGPVTFAIDRLTLAIGATAMTYDTSSAPGCSDGVDDTGDLDALVDYPADPQCTGPTDDSEVKAGAQTRIAPRLTGTIASDGTVSVPTTGVVLPVVYLEQAGAGGDNVVTATAVATHPITGRVDPDSGAIDLRVRLSIKVQAQNLPSGCVVGTTAAPVDIAALRHTTAGGAAYNPVSGTGAVADRTYSVPKSSSCGLFTSGSVDNGLGLPSPSGSNVAVLALRTTPVLQPGAPPTTTPASTSSTTTTKPTTTSSSSSSTSTTKPTTTTVKPTTTTVKPTTTTSPGATTTTGPKVATSIVATPLSMPNSSWYSIQFQATLKTTAGAAIPAVPVSFRSSQGHSCNGTTSASGVATCRIFVWGNATRPSSYTASFAGDTTRLPATSAPASISYT